ncbi:MAG: thiamine diphosphokinase [Anaerolineae bacterium]|nr:MAG: thiamine diphosphokinase [Anaerolineae bacterium]MCL4877262.1 thiamine diphosphokinase [Anaerolineae bacterium]
MVTVIFANGEFADGPAVREALDAADFVIAADGGAEHALRAGMKVALVIGDMDSISSPTLEKLANSYVEIQKFPPEKNETDLELALLEAARRDLSAIRVIGALGDRLDQTLANIYLLGLPQLVGRDARLVSGKQTMWLISAGDHVIMGRPGDTISLIPMGGAVSGVVTSGLKYPLNNETLQFGPARGISNVIEHESPRITVASGLLMVVHTIGRA